MAAPARANARASRAHRAKVGLVELVVSLTLVAGLTGVAVAVYGRLERATRDKVAETDLYNAAGVLENCQQDYTAPPAVAFSVTADRPMQPCPGQTLSASAGTVITYSPGAPGAAWVLRASNSGGRPTYYCYDASASGRIATVDRSDSLC